jgi:hypothetical protein
LTSKPPILVSGLPFLMMLANLIDDQFGNRFRGFQHDIAGKSIGDGHIHCAADDLFAFHVAEVIQI